MSEIKQLDYSPPDARLRRRWIVIAIFLAIISLPVGVEVKQLAEYWSNRFRNISAQHRCLIYTQTPGSVVYEEDPTAATKLAGGRLMGEGWSTLSSTGRPGGTTLGYFATAPRCFQQVGFGDWGLVADVPSFFHAWTINSGASYFVFMGGRSTATGLERLIYVSLSGYFALRQGAPKVFGPVPAVLNWFVIEPATWTTPMKILQSGTWEDQTFRINMPWPLRMYAGQADANNSSRFSLPYRTPDGAFAVDGQLLPNDQVNFSIREASRSDGPMP